VPKAQSIGKRNKNTGSAQTSARHDRFPCGRKAPRSRTRHKAPQQGTGGRTTGRGTPKHPNNKRAKCREVMAPRQNLDADPESALTVERKGENAAKKTPDVAATPACDAAPLPCGPCDLVFGIGPSRDGFLLPISFFVSDLVFCFRSRFLFPISFFVSDLVSASPISFFVSDLVFCFRSRFLFPISFFVFDLVSVCRSRFLSPISFFVPDLVFCFRSRFLFPILFRCGSRLISCFRSRFAVDLHSKGRISFQRRSQFKVAISFVVSDLVSLWISFDFRATDFETAAR